MCHHHNEHDLKHSSYSLEMRVLICRIFFACPDCKAPVRKTFVLLWGVTDANMWPSVSFAIYLNLPLFCTGSLKSLYHKNPPQFHKSNKQLNRYMPLRIDTTWNGCIFLSLFYMIAETAICTYLCMSNSCFLGSKAKGGHWLLLCASRCVHRDL